MLFNCSIERPLKQFPSLGTAAMNHTHTLTHLLVGWIWYGGADLFGLFATEIWKGETERCNQSGKTEEQEGGLPVLLPCLPPSRLFLSLAWF